MAKQKETRFKVKDSLSYTNDYNTPKGNNYLFFRGRFTAILDKEDIEWFRNNPVFEEEGKSETKPKEKKEGIIQKIGKKLKKKSK